MSDIPPQLKRNYQQFLQRLDIPPHNHSFYLKWLRYYLDFCGKYHHAPFTRQTWPESSTAGDVKAFLTHLAVRRQVSTPFRAQP